MRSDGDLEGESEYLRQNDVQGGEPATATEMSRLVGSGELDLKGYLLCMLVVFVIACLCMITSRLGVIRVLSSRLVEATSARA